MPSNRRVPLLVGVAACALTVAAALAVGGARRSPAPSPTPTDSLSVRIPAPDALRAMPLRPHPRLIAPAERFEALREEIRSDPVARHWYGLLKTRADGYLAAGDRPQYITPDGLRLLKTSRRVLDHVSTLALVAKMEQDPRYVAGVWAELQAAAAFPDWNPKHFLDVGEMTTAFSIGYDWLYDQWTEDQRETLRKAIVEKGLTPALQAYRGEAGELGGWVKKNNNWNQVTNGGIGIGALAVMDREPEMASEILHDGLSHLPLAMRYYAPDGAWNEGPGYWHYATLYSALILSSLHTALGTDFGLSDIPGFDQAGWFPIYVTSPSGPAFAFADVDRNTGPTRGAEMLWLANRFHQPTFAAHQLRYGHDLDEGRSSAFNLLWYDPALTAGSADALPLDHYFRVAEVVTMRSAWNDPDALFVGFKGGDNKAHHTNLDLGDFVLDALGVRWATELGSDDYNLPDYWGYATLGGQRWKYYRMRAEGQNTLVIDPDTLADQDPAAVAEIVAHGSTPDRAFAVTDLSAAYDRHARSVKRGIALIDGRRNALVQDEIQTREPARVWWFMHTEAAAEVGADGSTAMLTRDGKRLWAKILAPAGARFQVMDARALPGTANPPGQNPNEGIRKLAIRLDDVSDTRIAVLFVPLTAAGSPPRSVPAVRPLASW